MSIKKEEMAAPEAAAAKTEAQAKEDIYSADELVGAARSIFKVEPECVRAALNYAGKNGASLTEAKKLVNKFMNKEVK